MQNHGIGVPPVITGARLTVPQVNSVRIITEVVAATINEVVVVDDVLKRTLHISMSMMNEGGDKNKYKE